MDSTCQGVAAADGAAHLGIAAQAPIAADRGAGRVPVPYAPPTITPLGSLADLTQGGLGDEDDGFGGAGASGSI